MSEQNHSEITDDQLYELADSDECNPDKSGWGRKFDFVAFGRAAIRLALSAPQEASKPETEPVAEVVECPTMGGQTLREIDGRWKFLKTGTKLYTLEASYVRGYQDGVAAGHNSQHGLKYVGADNHYSKEASKAVPVADEMPKQNWAPYLSDRADGVRGHFAIARWNTRGYREVWNLLTHRWSAFSDEVLTRPEAEALLEAITIPSQAEPTSKGEAVEELSRALAVIGVVGQIDGYDVIRRESVLEVAQRRRGA